MGRYDYEDNDYTTPLKAEASGLHASYTSPLPVTNNHITFDHTSHMAGGSIPTGVGSTLVCLCLTLVAIVTSSRAVTHVAIDTVSASPSIQAGPGRTLINIRLAVVACVSRLARACVQVDTINAQPSILAGVGTTVIDVGLAVGPSIARYAPTREGVNTIRACPSIVAGVGAAVVDVCLAVSTHVASNARAPVPSRTIISTGGSILAGGATLAGEKIDITESSSIPTTTDTLIGDVAVATY